jgi:stage II sporulation protein E
MLHKEELIPYRRLQGMPRNLISGETNYFSLQHIILYLSVFLAARVFMFDALMPFGISIFIAVFGVHDKKTSFLSGIFAAAGYLCTFNGYISVNHAVTIFILLIFMILINEKDKNRIVKMCAAAFFINFVVNMFFHARFISGGFVSYDVMLCGVESVIAVASSFIFSYAMPLYVESEILDIRPKETPSAAPIADPSTYPAIKTKKNAVMFLNEKP